MAGDPLDGPSIFVVGMHAMCCCKSRRCPPQAMLKTLMAKQMSTSVSQVQHVHEVCKTPISQGRFTDVVMQRISMVQTSTRSHRPSWLCLNDATKQAA